MANPQVGYSFEITAYGGKNVNTIGMNCDDIAFYHPETTRKDRKTGEEIKYRPVDRCIIDLGAGSGDFRAWGFHRLLPDIRHLLDDTDKLLLTHAHGDHMEAIFYYLVSPYFTSRGGEEMGHTLPPIWGTAYTIEKVKQFLDLRLGRIMNSKSISDAHKNDMLRRIEDCKNSMRIFYPGQTIRVGKAIDVTVVPMSHSTLHCVGFHIQTPTGSIFYSGDFNMDDTYLAPGHYDEEMLREIGEKGVDVALIDSTGADKTEANATEAAVRESLMDLINAHPDKRAIIPVMGGYDQRLISIMDVARKTGRDLYVAGTSLKVTFDLFQKMGLIPADLKVKYINRPEQENMTPRHKAIVITTGAQGERNTPLHLALTDRNYNLMTLDPKRDFLIFSASLLGINNARMQPILSQLDRRGFTYYSKKNCDHVLNASGHASIPGLKKLLGWIKPQFAFPAHGMLDGRGEGKNKGLLYHCLDVIQSMGIRGGIIRNGQTWRIDHPQGEPKMVKDNTAHHRWIGVSVLANQQDRTEEYKFTVVRPAEEKEDRRNEFNVGRSFDHTV